MVLAGAALTNAMLAPSTGAAASAAYYGYCPDGSASAVYYTYCPPPNRPPDCSNVAASPTTLWPPNHRLVLVTLSGAADPDGDAVTLTITGVTQDEPLNGVGDGNTSPDAQSGALPNTVHLRAERSGTGDGRVYRISFTGSDGLGGTCSGTVTVGVPHDMGQGSTAIDSAPPSFDSFGP
ncbi:MAG: hypothetical protein ACRDN6_14815 [Gaiellaceae bacterium]